MREALRRPFMDYIVAGICAVLLFFYLIYALVKPERF
jgi:K+-transporting ATPase KdpF subunit